MIIVFCLPTFAKNEIKNIYVPAYSSIFYGNNSSEFDLTVTLTVRNINMKNSIIINEISYFNTSGKLVKRYLDKQTLVKPLETISFVVNESDTHGGVGANFIVKWSSLKEVKAPLVETIMIGAKGQQGISFSSRGVNID
jgi:hypothetical protein